MKILILTVALTLITFNASAQQSIKDTINHTVYDLLLLRGIELTPLFETNYRCSAANEDYFSTETFSGDDSTIVQNNLNYSYDYRVYPIQLVDSVDVTGDGVKEWILLRTGICYMTSLPEQPYGVGNQQHTIAVYEVWDIKEKKQLFAFTSTCKSMLTVSTNVIQSFGYNFEVTPGRNGSFRISGNTSDSGFEPGTYLYNREKGMYEKR